MQENLMQENVRPTSEQWKQELKREMHKIEYAKMLRSTVFILLVVAAVAVLIAMLWLPVLQVTGTSMEPTLDSGQIVVAVKNAKFETSDLIAFYYNNKILLKRVIAVEGDYVEIGADGTVSVNNVKLEEPYLPEKSLGECDIEFPYQVPDGKIFVLGDHRITSIDSRSTDVGCIAKENVLGKVYFRVWPLSKAGGLK